MTMEIPYERNFTELLQDYEILKTVYEDSISLSEIDNDSKCLKVSILLRYQTPASKGIIDIIKEMKFHELILDEETIHLPFQIHMEYKHHRKSVAFKFECFWMKREMNSFIEENSAIEEDGLLFNVVEYFKLFIKEPEKQTLLNWLQRTKEDTIIDSNARIFKIDNKEDSDYEDYEIQDKQNLILLRSSLLTEDTGKPNDRPKQENSNSNEQGSEYDQFITQGGIVGELIVDRKSSFQAHAITVKSKHKIKELESMLKTNNKISKATHNITAYRIRKGKEMESGFNDDGETRAGERLLQMIENMGAVNIYVMVSRWFGGIKLGTDRFKHINDSAKILIQLNKNQFEFTSK